jgi:hypothetical protein
MSKAPDCTLMSGKMRDACIATNKSLGYDEHGNTVPGAPQNTGGNSFFGIPLPSSDWWRHFIFRMAEVVVGVGMVIVGVKAFASSSDTTKVIVTGAKKVGAKVS